MLTKHLLRADGLVVTRTNAIGR